MGGGDKQPRLGGLNLKRWIPPLLVLGLLLLAWSMGWLEFFSLSSLVMHRETLVGFVADNFVTALAAYFIIYVILVGISFPGASLLTITGGFLFGGPVAGTLTVFSATSGAVIIFLIARSTFGDFLQEKAGPFVGRLISGFQEDSFLYLLTIRLTPVVPFWALNIVPALLNMRVVPYAVATMIGIIPGTFAYSYVGAGLGSVIAAQEELNPGCGAVGTCKIDPSALVTKEILIAMLALAFVSLLPILIKKLRGRTAAPVQPNPVQPNPVQPNPAQPNPVQPNNDHASDNLPTNSE